MLLLQLVPAPLLILPISQARCLELESQGAELRGALAEATARMERFRRSYKDTGALLLVGVAVKVLALCPAYFVKLSVSSDASL